MGRPCLICGAPNSTEEHVWPGWLQKIATTPIGNIRVGITTDPAGWREWTGAAFQNTSRVLCQDCNRSLGELEGKAAQLIPLMVGDGYVRLVAAEQELLAQWMYKTGLMVSTTLRHEASSLPTSHYVELGTSRDLPPASAVWIAQIQDPAYEAALWVQRFLWQDKELASAPVGQGYMFAISVRDLAGLVAVLDSRQSPESPDLFPFKLGGAAIGRLFRIWPSSKHYGVQWPPAVKITAADFQSLADSLQRLGPPYADMDTTAGAISRR